MRIPSGTTDQYIYFVAVDSTDLNSRETGLSSFTVYRSRNGAAASAMTTPTINETDATNMPGVYELLLDEDMTIAAGNDTEEMAFHITHAGMAPVTRTIELYRPKITEGRTLSVETDGDLTKVNTLDGHTAQTGDSYARLGAPAGASVSADIATIDGNVDDILVDTAEIGVAGAGLTEAGGTGDHLTALPLNDLSAAEVNAEVDSALNTAIPGTPTAGSVNERIATLDDNYTAARAGYLDNINGHTAQTGDSFARLGAPAGASVSADIAALPTADENADANWDEAKADHNAAGSMGEEQQNHALSTEIAALNDPTAAAIATEILATAYEGTDTIQDFLRLATSVLYGKSAGGGTGTLTFRNIADTLNRISATVDGDGNRSAVTTNVS